jgi:4,5-DOPA dioxygenase extradiol
MFPTLFVSHGSPMTVLLDAPARDFMSTLGRRVGRPKAVLMISAHWETATPVVNAVGTNDTIHDFYGFPRPLYDIRYPAPGSTDLAERVADLLCAAGLPSGTDGQRGLDHGAWTPLLLMYPEHDIPVVQLSIQSHLGAAHHLQLGRALEALRQEDVLVIGSGSFTHDLARFRGAPIDAPELPDVRDFAEWMHAALLEGRTADLLTYRRQAPFATREHPTEDHILPLFVALGAAGEGATAERLHASTMYGILCMDSYAFQ